MKVIEVHTKTLDAKALNLNLDGGIDLIYGPNEAGKSTLRTFLTSSLVQPAPPGRRRKDHPPSNRHAPGRLVVEMESGIAEVEFNESSEITSISGSSLATREFELARSTLDPSIYSKIYCVDVKEVAGLGVMTSEELQNFLYQLSIFGNFEEGRTLQRIIESLNKEKDALFSSSANARVPLINKEIRELREFEKELGSQRKRVRSYEKEILEQSKVAHDIATTKEAIKDYETKIQGYNRLLEISTLNIELFHLRQQIPFATLPNSYLEVENIVRTLEELKSSQRELEQTLNRKQEFDADLDKYRSDLVNSLDLLHYQQLKDARVQLLFDKAKHYQDKIGEYMSKKQDLQKKLGMNESQLIGLTDEIYTLQVKKSILDSVGYAQIESAKLREAQREIDSLGSESDTFTSIEHLQGEIEYKRSELETLDSFIRLKQGQDTNLSRFIFPNILLILLMVLLVATVILALTSHDLSIDLTSLLATFLASYLVVVSYRARNTTETYSEYKTLEEQLTKRYATKTLSSIEIEHKRSSLREDLRDLDNQISKVKEKKERRCDASKEVTQGKEYLDRIQEYIGSTFKSCGIEIDVPFETAAECLELLQTLRSTDKALKEHIALLDEVNKHLEGVVQLAQTLGLSIDSNEELSLSYAADKVDEVLRRHENAVAKVKEATEKRQILEREMESRVAQLHTKRDRARLSLARLEVELELDKLESIDAITETLRNTSRTLAEYESRLTISQQRQKEVENTFSPTALEELAKLSKEELNVALDQLAVDRESLLAKLELSQNRFGELNQLIREAEENSPIVTESRLNAKTEQLHSHIRQYVVTEAVKRLVQEVREFRERTTRPAVLEEASTIFQLITHGRYQMVGTRDPSEGGIFVELRDTKERRSLSQLSTGTLEELSLAIRIGYIIVHGQGTHNYPIVLDDVLVNFDRSRAKAALEALSEISARQNRQIILLTCHDREQDLYSELLSKKPALM